MNFLKRLLGYVFKSDSPTGNASATAKPADASGSIQVFDEFGRELSITRDQWRTGVLLGTLKKEWNNPDNLYQVVVQSLGDGFRVDVRRAAEHLYKMDTTQAKYACLWGVILLEEGKLREAEKVFERYLSKIGDDGYVLTNLAKVQLKQGKTKECVETLWHALEVDPNQTHGLDLYVSMLTERDITSGRQEALRRVAALPTSWLAQLWLARDLLEAKQWSEALALYQESLARAGTPTPSEALWQISGDLGNHDQVVALLRLTEPRFDASLHGLPVGANLVHAHLELGQPDEAHKILEDLYKQKRPDWQQALQILEGEILTKRMSISVVPKPESMEMRVLSFSSPLWLPAGSPAEALFRISQGAPESPSFCFMGSSVDEGGNETSITRQKSSDAGRLTRSLPMFLSEQTALRMGARCRTLVPFIVKPDSGFVVSGAAFEDDYISHLAREGTDPADYAILSHLVSKSVEWTIHMRVVRTIDGTCLDSSEWLFEPKDLEASVGKIVTHLHLTLQDCAGIAACSPNGTYCIPSGYYFRDYLLRLEQLLAVRCSHEEGCGAQFLSGAREIIEGNINLCLECPENITTRTMLAQTIESMKETRPEVILEFRDRIARLQQLKQLPSPAHGILQRAIKKALDA